MGLPVNRAKIKGIAGLPLPAMIDEARKRNVKTLGVTSVNKGLSRMATFFSWAVRHDYIGVNPVMGIKLKNPVQARDQRHPFDSADLRKIFTAPVYTGCHSEAHWSQKGDEILKDSPKYWVPLLGLYTGARLNEICQLRVADVQEQNGIHYLHIDDEGEGQRLKNQGSRRDIPLHPDLISFGFLEYTKRITQQGHSQLFPTLKRDSNGYYSDGFNKHFGRFLKSVGAKTEKKSFHSFRHSFEDACRNNGVDSGIMDALQGHAQQGMAGRYGSGYSLEVKARAVGRVRYEGVVLTEAPRG